MQHLRVDQRLQLTQIVKIGRRFSARLCVPAPGGNRSGTAERFGNALDGPGELQRILASQACDASSRNRQFLNWTGDRIKAYGIAARMFRCGDGFGQQ